MFYRSLSPDFDFLPAMEKALSTFEGRGGIPGTVNFRQTLSPAQIKSLQTDYGINFAGQEDTTPTYRVVIPDGSVIAISVLPYVEQIDSSVFALPLPPEPGKTLGQEKIGGGLVTFMRDMEYRWWTSIPEYVETVRAFDQLGGVKIGISFEYKLSRREIEALETWFGIKFFNLGSTLQDLTPSYSAAIPPGSIRPVSRIPFVKQIECYTWPPTMPSPRTTPPPANPGQSGR
ncbi:MAG: hypothetical protein HY673_24090 [Chloroflexi bacterium]|nr:hypothetical protein [Chloroflexota bacterium]